MLCYYGRDLTTIRNDCEEKRKKKSLNYCCGSRDSSFDKGGWNLTTERVFYLN